MGSLNNEVQHTELCSSGSPLSWLSPVLWQLPALPQRALGELAAPRGLWCWLDGTKDFTTWRCSVVQVLSKYCPRVQNVHDVRIMMIKCPKKHTKKLGDRSGLHGDMALIDHLLSHGAQILNLLLSPKDVVVW